MKTFEDQSLKEINTQQKILNESFLKYVFVVIGYQSDDIEKCLQKTDFNNQREAIRNFRKIWANKDTLKPSITKILKNMACGEIQDLQTKLDFNSTLEKLLKEMKQFIKTMKKFMKNLNKKCNNKLRNHFNSLKILVPIYFSCIYLCDKNFPFR